MIGYAAHYLSWCKQLLLCVFQVSVKRVSIKFWTTSSFILKQLDFQLSISMRDCWLGSGCALQQLTLFSFNSEAREWRHDSDKTQTNIPEWWMILKISLRAKASVPKTLVKRKFRLYSLYFPQKTLVLTESRGEFSDLHSIFRLCALRYLTPLFFTRE